MLTLSVTICCKISGQVGRYPIYTVTAYEWSDLYRRSGLFVWLYQL